MNEICSKCGLPKDLCVCQTIAKEGQRIKVKIEKRKFGKLITVIYGINKKEIDLRELAKELKTKFACGGTVKGDTIELQGEHAEKTKEELTKLGFSQDSIETN